MQDDTSLMPTGTKAVKSMAGLSASMMMTARAPPSVVVGGAQESLVDGPADELAGGLIVPQHVLQ
jgi:hypothetical protein